MSMTESGNNMILTGRNRCGPDGVWNMVVTSFRLCLCITCSPWNLWSCQWTMRSLTGSHFFYRCGGQVLILPMYPTHKCAYMHTMVDSLGQFSSRKDIVTELSLWDHEWEWTASFFSDRNICGLDSCLLVMMALFYLLYCRPCSQRYLWCCELIFRLLRGSPFSRRCGGKVLIGPTQ